MQKRSIIYLLIAAGLVIVAMGIVAYKKFLVPFLRTWEGFSATPYWDYKQWSWGYGTRVTGSVNDPNIRPGGTITRTQAMLDALAHVQADYSYLKPLITAPLNARQWAALLSFSYNEGPGNADNLVANINAQDLSALEYQWKLYNKVREGGVLVVSSDLVDRRNAEWTLFVS